MKVVQFDDVTPVRGLEHRGGTFHSRTTAAGEPGTPGNFKFSVSELGTDYSGPRHRHNFDQYRFMLSGESDYGQDGPLKAGMLGYYPEGVPYGPQVNNTAIVCAVLQFGGASGSGYLQPREVKAGMEELKKFGEFKDGVFHRREDVPGKRSMDAYQAIWEHVHGRPMIYPKGRYDAPIMMDAANYQWAPIKGAPGASRKAVRGVHRAAHPGAAGAARGRRRLWGRGQGRLSGSFRRRRGRGQAAAEVHHRVSRDRRDRHARASETTELLHYGLPDLSDLEMGYTRAPPCRRPSRPTEPCGGFRAEAWCRVPARARWRSASRARAAPRPRGRLLPRQDPDPDRRLRARRRRRYPGPHHRAPSGAVHSGPARHDRAEHGRRGRRARHQLPQSARRARRPHHLHARPLVVRGRRGDGGRRSASIRPVSPTSAAPAARTRSPMCGPRPASSRSPISRPRARP